MNNTDELTNGSIELRRFIADVKAMGLTPTAVQVDKTVSPVIRVIYRAEFKSREDHG